MRKEKSGRAGAFWGGTFVGFLLTLALLAGIGCLIYFKASANFINKTFKTDIDLGSDELNSKTINQLVADVNGIIKNKETYSINDLAEDFGVEITDTLFGIKIDDLKSVGLSKLPQAVEKKFGAISADELRSVAGLNLESEMGHILKQTCRYYYKSADGKLYEKLESGTYSNPVQFDYEIVEESGSKKVITKGHKTTIVGGVAEIQLWYLPLTSALGDFTANLGTNLTLKTLEEDFGINLPSFLDNDRVNKENTTINGLETAINSLYIADFLGYTVDDTDHSNIIVKDKNDTVVTGLMADLAITLIGDLDNGAIEDIVGDMSARELGGTVDLSGMSNILDKYNTYYLNTVDGKLYKNYDGTTYSGEVGFDCYTVSANKTTISIKDKDCAVVGGAIKAQLWDLPLASAIGDFTSNMGDNLTLTDLTSFGVVLPSFFNNINRDATTINQLESAIDNLYIADFLGYTVEAGVVKNGETEVTGFMKTIALKTIAELDKDSAGGGLEGTINNMQVAEILGLTIKNESGADVVYDGVNKVEGVLATVAKFKVSELKDGISGLKLTDIFGEEDFNSGLLSLIDNPQNVTIDNIPEAIQNAVTNSSLNELSGKGVIMLSDADKAKLVVLIDHDNNPGTNNVALGTLTIDELLAYFFNFVPSP